MTNYERLKFVKGFYCLAGHRVLVRNKNLKTSKPQNTKPTDHGCGQLKKQDTIMFDGDVRMSS